MLSPTEERVIWRLARAQRAYWRLVDKYRDDARRRLGVHTRLVEVRAELHGDPPPRFDGGDSVPLWRPLREAVRAELRARLPEITIQVAYRRERKRLAIGCAPTELVLGHWPRLRRKLRRIIYESQLSIREVACAIGVATSTLDRHLAGARPSGERLAFYHALEAISYDAEQRMYVVLVAGGRARKKFGWRPAWDEDDG